jgi:hypothetical protein
MIEAVSVNPLPDYRLLIEFNTGEKKIYDFKPQLTLPAFRGLKNTVLFSKARVVYGGIVWNDEIDIAVETVYQDGVPVSPA